MTDRHPSTTHLLSLFEYSHLPPHLAEVSMEFRQMARNTVDVLGDGPELTTGLRKLLEAKDCFVRQAVIDHRPGVSVTVTTNVQATDEQRAADGVRRAQLGVREAQQNLRDTYRNG